MALIEFGTLTCALIFISQILKVNFRVDKKHIPKINILIGMLLCGVFPALLPNATLTNRLLHGLVVGMSACGGYSFCMSFKNKEKWSDSVRKN